MIQDLPLYRLLVAKPSVAKHVNSLAELLLRSDETSTLTRGERELIFATASWANGCRACAAFHATCAKLQLSNPDYVEAVRIAGACALANDTPKLHELIHIAIEVAENTGQMLSMVMKKSTDLARKEGASDADIHDAVLIASFACMCNRYVDALLPDSVRNPDLYVQVAQAVIAHGYEAI